jgi:LacI family transcriptional regulator
MNARKRSVTMNDVASQAGVSIKTVSNVINDWPYITDETRQKVLEAIEAVGYRPNRMARSLVTGETRTIGVVIPDVANPFFGTAVRACEDVLYENGYSIFLCNTSEDLDRERYYLDQLLSRGVDGLILWGTRICCSELERLIGADTPLVTVELGEEPAGTHHTAINVDDIGGAEWIVAHLIAEGHRAIAHIAGPQSRITPQRRREGYLRGLRAAGLTPDDSYLLTEEPSVAGGFRAATALLNRPRRPDALFCYNDLMAEGALLAARRLDLRVPDDLAVAGFDDIETASIVDPPLTTVRISQTGLGRFAGEALLSRLQSPAGRGSQETSRAHGPTSALYPVELIIRGSSSKGRLTDQERRTTLEQLVASFISPATTAPANHTPLPAEKSE